MATNHCAQKQGERIVIGGKFGAALRRDAQARAIDCNDSQAMPAMCIDPRIYQTQQLGVEMIEHRPGQPAPRFGERTIRALTSVHAGAMNLGEKIIERGLHGTADTGEHHREEAWRSERALAGEGGRNEAKLFDQRRTEELDGELRQQRPWVEYLSSYFLNINAFRS